MKLDGNSFSSETFAIEMVNNKTITAGFTDYVNACQIFTPGYCGAVMFTVKPNIKNISMRRNNSFICCFLNKQARESNSRLGID